MCAEMSTARCLHETGGIARASASAGPSSPLLPASDCPQKPSSSAEMPLRVPPFFTFGLFFCLSSFFFCSWKQPIKHCLQPTNSTIVRMLIYLATGAHTHNYFQFSYSHKPECLFYVKNYRGCLKVDFSSASCWSFTGCPFKIKGEKGIKVFSILFPLCI